MKAIMTFLAMMASMLFAIIEVNAATNPAITDSEILGTGPDGDRPGFTVAQNKIEKDEGKNEGKDGKKDKGNSEDEEDELDEDDC
jgi:hypothetical protein|tara:strand:+ start:166 stop:420 length:255 start_codon:yes stop_codon:yes gene_type:complete